MKNIKIKITQMPLIFSIIFFLLSVGIFYFIFQEVNKINSSAILAEKNFQQEKFKRKNLSLLVESIERTQIQRVNLEKHFVYSSDIVPFLNSIESLGPKLGMVIDVSFVDVLKDNSGMVVNFKTKGFFENVYKLLSLLENFKYELKVLGVSLTKEQLNEASVGNWQAEFKLKVVSFIP